MHTCSNNDNHNKHKRSKHDISIQAPKSQSSSTVAETLSSTNLFTFLGYQVLSPGPALQCPYLFL